MQKPHIIICKARGQDIPRDIEPLWTSASLVLSRMENMSCQELQGPRAETKQ